MAFNKDLASRLEEMAAMLELLGENRFRVNAHAKAARVVRDQTRDLSTLDTEELKAIDGIGKGMAERVAELRDTGEIADHDELLDRVPGGLLDVLEVPGRGPKTVKLMWDDLGIIDIAGLKAAIEDGSLAKLPRMGAKTIENIKSSLAFAASAGKRVPMGVAMPIAERIVEHVRAVDGVTRCEYAGSLRRGKDTIGDLDVLCVAEDGEAVREAFCTMPGVVDVIARGDTKCSVRLKMEWDLGRWSGALSEDDLGPTIQADLRLVPAASWGAALMYFTGSKEHNVRLRERSLKMGYTLNEYGLFPEDTTTDEPPQKRGVEAVAGESESEVYGKLELAWIPAEAREDRGELEIAQDEAEYIVELADIKSELHAHTTASDGKMSIEELAEAAKERGFHTIAVTDHSRSSAIAGGLEVDRLMEHIEAVKAADRKAKGIRILCGSEVDILADGSLDYDDDVLAQLDVVVASPHAALKQEGEVATKRLIRAIENRYVHVLGHPTGRLIGRREGLQPDMSAVIAAAVEHGVALEINAHWMRLDLRDSHVLAAVQAGANIAIDCDVHHPDDYDNLRYGVLTARRGRVPRGLCVNAWPARKLLKWLKDRRA